MTRLQDLLAAILPANRFHLSKLGPHPKVDRVEDLPFTTKQELVEDQLAHPPYGTNLTYPLERYSRFSQTSGTTGKPIRWLDTSESWDWMVASWARVFEAAGIGAGDRIFFAASFGPFLGFWVAFDAAARMGCLCIPGGGLRSAARLGVILDTAATVLCCTPTYAIQLGEVALEEGIDLRTSSVKAIVVAGEPGGAIPGTRTHIEKLWNGAKVVDHHGMTEVGPVSYSCPRRSGVLHVIESAYLAEIIDPESLAPVAPGGRGELVLTTLGRHGSPLLRYRTGDLVERGEGVCCACGSHDLALPGGILGRIDDMVVVRGVNVYPSAIEDILRGIGGIAEYQVEVRADRALLDLHVRVEPLPGAPDEASIRHSIEQAMRSALSLRVPVSIVPAGTLPRFEMKARRWIRP